MRTGRPKRAPLDRFFDRVNKDGPISRAGMTACWLWTGSKDRKGYGYFYADRGITRAHRGSWDLHFGAIPDGLLVCHKCDNPSCVNPDHLFLGTAADNLQDAAQKGRLSWSEATRPRAVIRRGPAHHNAKLTADAVREIRSLRASGVPSIALAARFGVSEGTIYGVVHRLVWRHVDADGAKSPARAAVQPGLFGGAP